MCPMKDFRLYRLVLWRLQYRPLKCTQKKDFVYADRPKPTFKYLFSHCECQHSFLSSGQVGEVQWLHKPRSSTSLQGFIWLDTPGGLICASLEICDRARDCRDSWDIFFWGGEGRRKKGGCIYYCTLIMLYINIYYFTIINGERLIVKTIRGPEPRGGPQVPVQQGSPLKHSHAHTNMLWPPSQRREGRLVEWKGKINIWSI